jgi:hypothetical protein
MSWPLGEVARSPRQRHPGGWLLPAALLTLTPKCLLCIAAYAGLGAGLGLGGPEICGASAGSPGSWASSLAWLGAALGAGGFFTFNRRGERARCVGPGKVSSEAS